jgi:hypothetical protein
MPAQVFLPVCLTVYYLSVYQIYCLSVKLSLAVCLIVCCLSAQLSFACLYKLPVSLAIYCLSVLRSLVVRLLVYITCPLTASITACRPTMYCLSNCLICLLLSV